MTDNLPELPEPHHAYQNGVGMDNWAGDYFTADQMRSYALTAIASERARADALQAELDLRRKSGSAVERLHNLCEGIAADADGSEFSREEWDRIDAENLDLRKRADALEAALRLWQGLYRRAINQANGLTNYVEDRPELRHAEKELAAIETAARSLLEKTPLTSKE